MVKRSVLTALLVTLLVCSMQGCNRRGAAHQEDSASNPQPPDTTEIPAANPNAHRPRSTVLGIFALLQPDLLQASGAQALRIIVKDDQIRQLYRTSSASPDNQIFRTLRRLHDRGIRVILTTRWPAESGSRYDRIPQGGERGHQLELFSRFLKDVGPYISVYSIQNEVGGRGPGSYRESDMKPDRNGAIPSIEWFTEVAAAARTVIRENASCSHILIASPTPIALRSVVLEPQRLRDNPFLVTYFHALLTFANDHCDALDIHLNRNTLAEMQQLIDYVQARVSVPLLATEWSATHEVHDWLDQRISNTARQLLRDSGINVNNLPTNESFIRSCYDHPVAPDIWNRFVQTAPHDPDYMQQSFELMKREGFLYACWALGVQYGDPGFDMCTLYAAKTTGQRTARNERFFNEFRVLAQNQ